MEALQAILDWNRLSDEIAKRRQAGKRSFFALIRDWEREKN